MPDKRSLIFGIFVLGSFWVGSVEAADGPPYYPGGTRLTIAAEVCFGPFTPEEFDRCVSFLIEGDFSLADDIEFVVLKNFVIMANTAFDSEARIYRISSDIEKTLGFFARIEGASFSRDLLSRCVLHYLNIGAVTYGRSDGEYLGCIERNMTFPR